MWEEGGKVTHPPARTPAHTRPHARTGTHAHAQVELVMTAPRDTKDPAVWKKGVVKRETGVLLVREGDGSKDCFELDLLQGWGHRDEEPRSNEVAARERLGVGHGHIRLAFNCEGYMMRLVRFADSMCDSEILLSPSQFEPQESANWMTWLKGVSGWGDCVTVHVPVHVPVFLSVSVSVPESVQN